MVKVLTNKQLLKNFKNIQWDSANGTLTPSLRIGKGKAAQVVYISAQQQILLEKEYHKKRLNRMKKAKSRGNVLMHLTAKTSADGQDLTHGAASRINALVRGFLTRRRLYRLRQATLLVQRAWTKMSPLTRTFRKHWHEVREKKIQERIMANRMEEILSRSDGLTEVVQSHMRMFICKIQFEDVVHAQKILPLQNFVRMCKVQGQLESIEAAAVLTQSRIRQLMMRHSADQSVELRIFKLKYHILRKYEMLLAPYTRRALFCYNTRNISQDTLRICVRELDDLKDRPKPFMDLDAFRCHLTFVLKKLYAKMDDERLVSIVRSVFQPDLIFHSGDRDRMLRRAKRASKSEKSNPILSLFNRKRKAEQESAALIAGAMMKSEELNTLLSDPNHIPLRFIMKEMVKELFSSKATLHRADFGAVIMLNYVMPDIILGVQANADEAEGAEEPLLEDGSERDNMRSSKRNLFGLQRQESESTVLVEN